MTGPKRKIKRWFQVVCSSNVDNADPLKCCAWINDRSSEVLEFATGGIDAGLTICRWNSEVNKKPVPVYSLRGHHGSVETVTAATENVICSAGQDKKVNIWKEISKSEETPDETRFFIEFLIYLLLLIILLF